MGRRCGRGMGRYGLGIGTGWTRVGREWGGMARASETVRAV